jgi:hypothetical protein
MQHWNRLKPKLVSGEIAQLLNKIKLRPVGQGVQTVTNQQLPVTNYSCQMITSNGFQLNKVPNPWFHSKV